MTEQERQQLINYCKFAPEQAACRQFDAIPAPVSTPQGSSLPPQNFSAEYGRGGGGDAYPEITQLQNDIAKIDLAIAVNPSNRKLKAMRKKAVGQLARLKKRFHLSGALSGLSDLAELGEEIPAIVSSIGDAAVKVVDAVKGRPAAPAAPLPARRTETSWTPYLIGAGVLVGGLWAWKAYKRRGR